MQGSDAGSTVPHFLCSYQHYPNFNASEDFFFSHKYVICQYKNALCEVCMKISSIDSLKNFIEHGFKENSFLNSMFPWSVWSQILLTIITHQLHHLIIIPTPSINHKMMLKKGIIIHPQVDVKNGLKNDFKIFCTW